MELICFGHEYGSGDQHSPGIVLTVTCCCCVLQVFVKGEFVGGSDILMEMHKAGELGQLADEMKK